MMCTCPLDVEFFFKVGEIFHQKIDFSTPTWRFSKNYSRSVRTPTHDINACKRQLRCSSFIWIRRDHAKCRSWLQIIVQSAKHLGVQKLTNTDPIQFFQQFWKNYSIPIASGYYTNAIIINRRLWSFSFVWNTKNDVHSLTRRRNVLQSSGDFPQKIDFSTATWRFSKKIFKVGKHANTWYKCSQTTATMLLFH